MQLNARRHLEWRAATCRTGVAPVSIIKKLPSPFSEPIAGGKPNASRRSRIVRDRRDACPTAWIRLNRVSKSSHAAQPFQRFPRLAAHGTQLKLGVNEREPAQSLRTRNESRTRRRQRICLLVRAAASSHVVKMQSTRAAASRKSGMTISAPTPSRR